MTRVDQFESVFRSASKEVFHASELQLEHVHVVADLEGHAALQFTRALEQFLSVLGSELRWTSSTLDQARNLGSLLEDIQTQAPDLVCTYRNLFSDSWNHPHSLGEQVDVLTQIAPCPVLLLPHPGPSPDASEWTRGTQQVLAMGGHLAADHSLIDWALAMTAPGGTLRIAHVEDDRILSRYVDAISKIPAIDTEEARETIIAQLLKEPREYIESVARDLRSRSDAPRVVGDVRMGHRLDVYRRLIEEHTVDLLVMHTKDEDQMAMHGLAYPLAVELCTTPLLLL